MQAVLHRIIITDGWVGFEHAMVDGVSVDAFGVEDYADLDIST